MTENPTLMDRFGKSLGTNQPTWLAGLAKRASLPRPPTLRLDNHGGYLKHKNIRQLPHRGFPQFNDMSSSQLNYCI